MAVAARAAAACLLVLSVAGGAAAWRGSVAEPARGGEQAVRGTQELVDPNAVPTYPTGPCDATSGGLGLAAGQVPGAVYEFGRSVEGRPLVAEHWGPIGGPQLLVVATVHGDECTPATFVRQARALGATSTVGIWLIPVLNPDAYVIGSRYNAAGADINRDGFFLEQPESRALVEFTELVEPALSVHVHSPMAAVSAWGPPISHDAAHVVTAVTGWRLATEATFRPPDLWYLWRGQVRAWPRGGTILVETNPITDWEAPEAHGRGAVVTLDFAEEQARVALAALAAVVSVQVPGSCTECHDG